MKSLPYDSEESLVGDDGLTDKARSLLRCEGSILVCPHCGFEVGEDCASGVCERKMLNVGAGRGSFLMRRDYVGSQIREGP